jgi:hypothetical protein
MLLSITTTHRPAGDLAAGDLGFLLHKHPDRFQSFDLSFGKAHVFYPEVSEDGCTACLMIDVDAVGLVRSKIGQQNFQLAQYVNDRSYVASSLMSVAISQVFSSALQGKCKDRPELKSIAQRVSRWRRSYSLVCRPAGNPRSIANGILRVMSESIWIC